MCDDKGYSYPNSNFSVVRVEQRIIIIIKNAREEGGEQFVPFHEKSLNICNCKPKKPKFHVKRYISYGSLCTYCLSLPGSIYSPLCGHNHKSHIGKVQILQNTECLVNAVFLELEAHVLF